VVIHKLRAKPRFLIPKVCVYHTLVGLILISLVSILQTYNSCEIFFQVEAPVEFVLRLVGAKTHSHMHLGFLPVNSLKGDAARHTCPAGASIGIDARLLTRSRLRLRIHILFIKKQFLNLK
jgi:hypothetical protein